MKKSSLTLKEIQETVQAIPDVSENYESVKILFAPRFVRGDDPGMMASVYKSVAGKKINTLLVIETYTGELQQKLTLPADDYFETDFGKVQADDFLREELCDEEDDFFISDSALNGDSMLYKQLEFAQAVLGDFKVVSVQICDYNTDIIRELASALDELLRDRNALPVFCCDISAGSHELLENLETLIKEKNEPGIKQLLQTGVDENKLHGGRALIAGLLLAEKWQLSVDFISPDSGADKIGGFAGFLKHQPA